MGYPFPNSVATRRGLSYRLIFLEIGAYEAVILFAADPLVTNASLRRSSPCREFRGFLSNSKTSCKASCYETLICPIPLLSLGGPKWKVQTRTLWITTPTSATRTMMRTGNRVAMMSGQMTGKKIRSKTKSQHTQQFQKRTPRNETI